MTDSWKVSLPCTRAEAEGLREDISPLALLDVPPVLMTSEADASQPEAWRLDAYFAEPPSPDMLAHLAALVPSAAGAAPAVERGGDRDWGTISQAGPEPIRAGRFFVHTPQHRGEAPEGYEPVRSAPGAPQPFRGKGDRLIALEIDAGRAFGTGQHETTSGCLEAISRMKD